MCNKGDKSYDKCNIRTQYVSKAGELPDAFKMHLSAPANHKAKISSDENRIETPPSVRKKLSSVTAVEKSITTVKLINLIIVGNNSYTLQPTS